MILTPILVAANTNRELSTIRRDDYTITLGVTQTTVGSSITVNWSAPEGHPTNDYLRLAQVNYADNNYNWGQVLGAGTSGSFSVTVPATAARYEFRMFRGTDNVRITQSQSFVANKANFSVSVNLLTIPAGGQFTTNWSVPADRPVNDRIVIAKSDNSAIITQQYTNSNNPPALNLTAPLQPGQYEVRYYEANAAPPSALSQIFTVEASAASIAGKVINGRTGEYVSNALVEILQNNVVKTSSTTNLNGSYTIPLSSTGTYDVKVSASGFPSASRTGIVLTEGSSSTVVNFELNDKGTVKGKITKSGSAIFIPYANVQLKQGTSIITTGKADFLGNYIFTSITPGNYSVDVSASGFTPQSQNNLSVAAGDTTTLNFSLTESQASGSSNLEYIYDDAGKLVATKEQGIIKNIYNYDLTGNLLSITSPQVSTPAIIDFSPRTGPPGTQVVVRGINFGSVSGQITVSFNNTNAPVVSVSDTNIITTVPLGATTGQISVSTASGTATSGSPFIVGSDTGNLVPTVTGFAPLIGHSGDLVTITGSNFESEASDNSVLFGANGAGVIAGTPSSLQVRANTSSGKISVTTPNGTGISEGEYLSVPDTIDITKLSYAGRTWFGNNRLVNIPAGDKKGAVIFDGILGKRFSIQLFELSSPIKIEIFRPDGRLLSASAFHNQAAAESWFIDTQLFPLTGTYTAIISPSGTTTSPTFFRMMVYDVPPDLSGEMPLNTYKKFLINTPGQNGLLTFNATAGQKILMNIKDNTYTGFASVTRVVTTNSPPPPVLNYGFQVMGTNFPPDGTTIPATGTYNLALNPSGPSTGPMDVSLYIVPPDPTYSMNIGSSETFYTTNPGQNAWVEFSGTAGQRISLQTKNITFTGGFEISLNKPDGTFFVTPRLANNGTFIDTLTLPATGTYKIYINPSGYNIGQTTIDLYNVPSDVIGSTSINGSAVTVTASVPGHNPTVTFDALQGQQARVNITGATFPNGTQIFLRKPDGNILVSSSVNSGAGLINSTTLPISGTYSVEVNPTGASLGTAALSIGGDVFGTITTGGNAGSVTINNSGQSAWLSFNGTAGQRVSIKFTNVSFASGSVYISKPDGSYLSNSARIGVNNSNFFDTVTLPVNGEYKVLIDPDSDYTGSASIVLYNVPADAAGTINVGGDSQTRTTTVPGQNLLLSFAGSVNQKISLEVTNVSIPNGTSVIIKKPDGTTLASAGVGATGTLLNNVVLPEAGTYGIFVDPSNDSVGGITLQIYGIGTGIPNPTIQFWQSVSVQKGLTSNIVSEFLSSVTVQKGAVPGTNPYGELTNSVSVKKETFFGNSVSSEISSSVSVKKEAFFGKITNSEISSAVSIRYGNQQNAILGASVSVSTGPIINSLSPVQVAKGGTAILTISGSNMENANAVRFFDSNGNLDTNVTATGFSVNSDGTVLTVAIQINSSAASGERIVVIKTLSQGLSRIDNATVNVINVTP